MSPWGPQTDIHRERFEASRAVAAQRRITPGEPAKLGQLVDTFLRAIEVSEFDRWLQMLEDRQTAGERLWAIR